MTFSLTALLRLLVILALVACGVAVGVARIATRRARLRVPPAANLASFNATFLSQSLGQSFYFDAETGRPVTPTLPEGERLDYVSLAPWDDEPGRGQLVGRWKSAPNPRGGIEFGLARFAYPGGEPLNQAVLDMIPASHPCWVPGESARILFAAGDSQLYTYDFSEPDLPASEPGQVRDQPRKLKWRCDPPGIGPVQMTDPIWPRDPRLGGRLIVSLSYTERSPGSNTTHFSNPALWWLKLDPEGGEIVSAGRLTVPPRGDTAFEERLASVATTSEGGLIVAFLTRGCDEFGWQLRVASVETRGAGDSALPFGSWGASAVTARGCAPTRPVLSSGGRWVYIVEREGLNDGRLKRFLVQETLQVTSPPEPLLVLKPRPRPHELLESRPFIRDHAS